MSVHFMSQSIDWATPKGVFCQLNEEFDFNCDPCALGGGMWFAWMGKSWGHDRGEDFNGLADDWGTSNFVNPPYGREIGLWTSKAVREWKRGKTVVMLIPSRTDTIWWHRDIMQADEIRFIKGRLKFGDSKNSAPFPSAVVVFNEDKSDESESE